MKITAVGDPGRRMRYNLHAQTPIVRQAGLGKFGGGAHREMTRPAIREPKGDR